MRKTNIKTGAETMTKAAAKTATAADTTTGNAAALIRELPLSKLVASAKNVRRTNRMAGVEELAASIAARGLLQSLAVRPVLGGEGKETGTFAVCGGGRRLAALQLLAKRKRIAKSYLVPCLVSTGDEEEASLAENIVRENLHPADQYEAFKRLADEQGCGAEEIAARFGVTPQVVRQRMRLGALSPKLMQEYRDGNLDLDQMMAFALTDDHARQEEVYARLSYNKDAYYIRRMLTETHVAATDRRAVFVGAAAYQAAGGSILRDLFNEDRGGYFEDAALLDRLANEKLTEIAATTQAEGWKWVEAHIDYPHAHGLKRVYPYLRELTSEEQAVCDALCDEQDALTLQAEDDEDCPESVFARLDAIETELEALREERFAPDDIARCGVFVVLNHDGTPRIERGYLRPADERAGKGEAGSAAGDGDGNDSANYAANGRGDSEPSDDEETKPLSDSLIRDLTAHRTLALRLALGDDADIALIAVTHALAAQSFYRGHDGGRLSCLEIKLASPPLGGHADGIEDSIGASKLLARHDNWARQMPKDARELWPFIVALDADSRMALFAHCAGLGVFAVDLAWDRQPLSAKHADALATSLALDMAALWQPTAKSYFGRVTKAQIIDDVVECLGVEAASRLADLKKSNMAEAAAQLVAGRGWLPKLLRTEGSADANMADPTRDDDPPASADEAAAVYEAAE